MDFELKTLGLAGAADEKCDALIVLVTDKFKPGKDALSLLVSGALAAKDLEPKAGKLLQAYRSAGIAAPRVVLAGAGDGSGKKVHAAVQSAVGSLRSSKAKRMVICLPAGCGDDAVRAAVAGLNVGKFRESDGDEFDITVRLPMQGRQTLQALDYIEVTSAAGRPVPLRPHRVQGNPQRWRGRSRAHSAPLAVQAVRAAVAARCTHHSPRPRPAPPPRLQHPVDPAALRARPAPLLRNE